MLRRSADTTGKGQGFRATTGNARVSNLLDLSPRPSGTSWSVVDDRVVLSVPRFPFPGGRAMCRLTRRSATITLSLDDYGSAAWLLLDGRRSVREAGEALRKKFGEEVEPLYPRLAEFITRLESAGHLVVCGNMR